MWPNNTGDAISNKSFYDIEWSCKYTFVSSNLRQVKELEDVDSQSNPLESNANAVESNTDMSANASTTL